MVTGARPLDGLVSYARQRSSGEFICASPVGEIHVFLQNGRVAWATDSRHPCAFSSHLQATAGIEPESFRQVVEECRRLRRPLGETLLAWGLATRELVRQSLGYQIGQAIALLASTPTGQTLFLGRAYDRYDEALTFELDELLSGLEAPAPKGCHDGSDGSCARCISERAAEPGADSTPKMRQPAGVVRELRRSVVGLSWAELLEDGRTVVDADPSSALAQTPAELIDTTVRDGADLAAFRAGCSSLLGLRMTSSHSLWCNVSADTPFATVVSAVCAATQGAVPPLDGAGAKCAERNTLVEWGPGSGFAGEIVRGFMERALDVLGAVVLSEDRGGEPAAAFGCEALEQDAVVSLARRRNRCFSQLSLPTTSATRDRLDALGFSLRTMVSGEPKLWCFGAELDVQRRETLWLFLDRNNPQGLGWAYLTALGRALSRGGGRASS